MHGPKNVQTNVITRFDFIGVSFYMNHPVVPDISKDLIASHIFMGSFRITLAERYLAI